MQTAIQQTVDHLFRHESGRMISVLSKMLGLQHLDAAQDLVQDTLLQALNTWSLNGLPHNPSAWLYRVAKNKAIDYLRRTKTSHQLAPQYSYLLQSEHTLTDTANQLFEEDEIQDSLLRMMFACCHPSIAVDAQIALALKTLCGLSVPEIAKAFLKDDDTIAKRIYRAKEKIKAGKIELELPAAAELPKRLDAVLHCLYLLFSEGYNSSHPDKLIREDLCEEAMRLAYILTQNKLTSLPRTNALLALFCFQAARLQTRLDDKGHIILLKYQDRTKWYRPLIEKGFAFLNAASKEETSVYHLEAAIAYLHASAPSFEETDWETIYSLYTILYHHHLTPVIALNKAISAAYALDKETALNQLRQIKGLEKYYLYHTAMADIIYELGRKEEAAQHYNIALQLTTSRAEQQLLQERLQACLL